MSLAFRLLVVSIPFAVWGVLWLALRISGVFPLRLTPWLKAGTLALFGVGVVFTVLDRTHLSNLAYLNAWALMGAEMWIRRRYGVENPSILTSLNLSRNAQDDPRSARYQTNHLQR